jgi:hypothetical protein
MPHSHTIHLCVALSFFKNEKSQNMGQALSAGQLKTLIEEDLGFSFIFAHPPSDGNLACAAVSRSRVFR